MHNYKLEFVSLNVNGLGENKKRRVLFEWFKNSKHLANITFLQETHSSKNIEGVWKSEWGGDIYFSHGTTNSKGVAILFEKDFEYKLIEEICDDAGRYLVLKIEVDQVPFLLVNFYAPTKNFESDQIACLECINSILSDRLHESIVMGGDFNTIFDPSLDKKGGSLANMPHNYTAQLLEFTKEIGLVDVWRRNNPDVQRFTWRQKHPLIQCRLDFWLISERLVPCTEKASIQVSIKSDHSKIQLTLKGSEFDARGPGFWKFNSELLTDKEYVKLVKNIVRDCEGKYEQLQDKNLKWDTIKCEIRGATIKFCKQKGKQTRQNEQNLNKRLEELEKDLTKAYRDESINSTLEEIDRVKGELEDILERRTRGSVVRSHAENCEGWEKQSKYFLSLEKRNYKNKCITKLRVGDQEVTSQNDILQEEAKYYSELYKSDNNKENRSETNFFDNDHIPKLLDNAKVKCEEDITEAECLKVLKTFKNNKSPGTDGLTAEFYKFFWPDIGKLVIESYMFSFASGLLSTDQRRGIITLTPKKDKDRTVLSNWRPISLLNVDYKILAKVIATRMKPYLPDIINSDQTGYVANRYIGENLRLISDVILYTNLKNNPGLILLVDFEKAFDTIEWHFIQKSLAAFNFGVTFRKWVALLYTDISSTVVNNGFSSDSFKVERGVRQGCPLSPFLFILAAEILAIAIRENKNISGIKIGEVEVKLSQLADDTTCFFSDEKSAKICLKVFDDFKNLSGLKVNLSKTEAIWIGRDKFNREGSLPIKWSNYFKTLGMKFDIHTDVRNENLDNCIEKMENVLKIWQGRQLSLIGKIVILKSLAISKLIYVVSSEHVPTNYITKIQDIIQKFLWSNGPSKIKLKVLQQPVKDGGLKAPNFEHQIIALRTMWIKRLLSESNSNWKHVSNAFFSDYFRLKDVFHSRCCFGSLVLNVPPFYLGVLKAWSKLKSLHTPKNPFEVRKEFIWFNPYIKINGNTVFFKHWYNKGISFINDIWDDVNCEFFSHEALNHKYGVNATFLDVLSIRTAIPRSWKYLLAGDNSNITSSSFRILFQYEDKLLPLCKMFSQDVRNMLVESERVVPTAEDKWEDIFNIEISKNIWEQIYKIAFENTLETRLQTFQYKVLHRVAAHNYLLEKFGYVNDNKCVKCNMIETIEHKYYLCSHVSCFWNDFVKWWNEKFDVEFILSLDRVLFGILHKKDSEVINYCILLAKYFINYTSNNNPMQNVYFLSYLQFLKRRLVLLEFIYVSKDKLTVFRESFGPLLEHFNI